MVKIQVRLETHHPTESYRKAALVRKMKKATPHRESVKRLSR
jgi:hypothetical protein